jgi:uncharacterized membrane protein
VLRRATPERLSFFSDGVFAVLITVPVLELRPPESPTFAALMALWPTWLSYAAAISWTRISQHHVARMSVSDIRDNANTTPDVAIADPGCGGYGR